MSPSRGWREGLRFLTPWGRSTREGSVFPLSGRTGTPRPLPLRKALGRSGAAPGMAGEGQAA